MKLADALGLGRRELVSFVGAGGKKTAMARLVGEADARDLATGYTTTTHVPPPDLPIAVAEPADLEPALERHDPPLAFAREWVDQPERADRKLRGFEPVVIDWLYRTRRFDWLLVKADGARRRGFKAPDPDEPVLPRESTVVVPTASVQVVGRPVGPDHVHRPERVAEIAGLAPGDRLTAAAVGAVLASDEGGLKAVPEAASACFLLNQADTAEDAATARDVLGHAFAGTDRPVNGLVTSFRTERCEVVTPADVA